MTVTMSVKKRTSPQEWIHDYFSPVLTVYANEDAELIANKNNLTFTELLQPFSKMTTDVTIKDVDGSNHNVPSLNIILQDFKKDPQKAVNQKLMLDRISEENCDEKDLISKHFEKLTLDAPGYTPWFDTWIKFYLQTLPVVEHEYLKHHLGCIFAVSTCSTNPVEQLRTLSANQHRHQHEKAGSYPTYFCPNILKYYVLVHDSYSAIDDGTAQELFTQVQNAFDSSNCHFLQVNSRNPESPEAPSPSIPDNWFSFTHRWISVETRRGKSFTSGMSTSPVISTDHNSAPSTSPTEDTLSHPLAYASLPDSPAPHTPAPRLTQATPKSVAALLTANDIDRIRIFTRELTIKCLIPYVEKQLRLLAEIVTNRKSRSLFSGAKRWFGSNKPNSAGGTSVVYSKEAPELQVRKLADLYFLLKLYKPAYNYFYIAKKDFLADEAWPYYAAAVELAALSMFMLSSSEPGKKYRPDYMEDSITKYLTLCQAPEFAVRATLFDGLCLKHQGLFTEAAISYIRMTNELSDLRSAMLLEQAAYCFLLANPASTRKYGFHIVLAGYRFTKTGGCKKHAARLYSQGAQVYAGRDWQLSTEHILYTLGHMKFMLKDFGAAAEYFNSLMEGAVGSGHLQQMVHLREFFLVHHARAKEDKSVVVITLPKLHSQQTVVRLDDREHREEMLTTWHTLEKVVKETISGQEMVHLTSTCQPVFSNTTTNHLNPQAVTGEIISVTITMENLFNTPLQLRKAHLLWKFTPEDNEQVFTNDKKEAVSSMYVETGVLEVVTIEKSSQSQLTFQLTVLTPGQLTVTGVEYSLKAMFPDKEPTDHEIRGKQIFSITPPHLNTVRDRKNRSLVGVDKRLDIMVVGQLPRLVVEMQTPDTMAQGELRCCELELKNTGPVAMGSVHLVSQTPGLLSFGKKKKGDKDQQKSSLYDFPLVQDNSSQFKRHREDGTVEQVSLDLLPVPLPDVSVQPGCSVRLPVWVRGPDTLGTSQHNLSVYYDTTISPSKSTPRLASLPLTLVSQPSLHVKCRRSGQLSHSNTPGKQMVVSLTNMSKDLVTSMDSLTVTQVVLVSRDQQLAVVQSSSAGCSVARGETTTLAVQTVQLETVEPQWRDMARLSQLPANVIIPGGRLYFTSVTARGTAGQPTHCPPATDFIKSYFTHNLGRRGNAPVLGQDLCVVIWRSGGSSPAMGQTVVVVDEGSEEVEEPVGVDGGSEELELIEPAPVYPVGVVVVVETEVVHDFSETNHCCVGVQVVMEGKGEKGVLIQYRLEEQVKGARVSGNTDGLAWLEVGEENRLELGVTISMPGFFHLKNLQFRAKSMDSCDKTYFEASGEDFLPVDISFTVRQAG